MHRALEYARLRNWLDKNDRDMRSAHKLPPFGMFSASYRASTMTMTSDAANAASVYFPTEETTTTTTDPPRQHLFFPSSSPSESDSSPSLDSSPAAAAAAAATAAAAEPMFFGETVANPDMVDEPLFTKWWGGAGNCAELTEIRERMLRVHRKRCPAPASSPLCHAMDLDLAEPKELEDASTDAVPILQTPPLQKRRRYADVVVGHGDTNTTASDAATVSNTTALDATVTLATEPAAEHAADAEPEPATEHAEVQQVEPELAAEPVTEPVTETVTEPAAAAAESAETAAEPAAEPALSAVPAASSWYNVFRWFGY